MPKYVWLAEYTTQSRFEHPTPNKRYLMGEIVIDATANAPVGSAVLLIRAPGLILYRRSPAAAFERASWAGTKEVDFVTGIPMWSWVSSKAVTGAQ